MVCLSYCGIHHWRTPPYFEFHVDLERWRWVDNPLATNSADPVRPLPNKKQSLRTDSFWFLEWSPQGKREGLRSLCSTSLMLVGACFPWVLTPEGPSSSRSSDSPRNENLPFGTAFQVAAGRVSLTLAWVGFWLGFLYSLALEGEWEATGAPSHHSKSP